MEPWNLGTRKLIIFFVWKERKKERVKTMKFLLFFGAENERKLGCFLEYFFSLFSLFSGNKKKGLKCANLLKKQTAARLCTRQFQGSRVPGSTLAGNPFPFFRKLFLFFQKFIFQIYKMDFIRVEPWNLGTHLLTH